MRQNSLIMVLICHSFLIGGQAFPQTVVIDTFSFYDENGFYEDVLWLQIPSSYNPSIAHPLLFGWHQYGANAFEFANATNFDGQCDRRGWLAASITGVSTTNWTNRLAQTSAEIALDYISSEYNVDESRIYMIGSSMGGGSGMIYHNNHLDPNDHMIAAAVSVSGIMDDTRRFIEQGYNQSMVNAFGGTSHQVPFEYRRYSPAYFREDTCSMHWNLKHLPVCLIAGTDDLPWLRHAEDMYELLTDYVDTVYFEQTPVVGHGWMVVDAVFACDWLENFTLEDNPVDINIAADEPDVYYWTEVMEMFQGDNFASYNAFYDTTQNYFQLNVNFNLGKIAVEAEFMGLNTSENLEFDWNIIQLQPSSLVLRDYSSQPEMIMRDGNTYNDWTYNSIGQEITINSSGSHHFTIMVESDSYRNDSGDNYTDLKTINDGGTLKMKFNTTGSVEIKIYNILGGLCFTQATDLSRSGDESYIETQLPDLANGIYLCSVKGDFGLKAWKLLILK